MWINIQLEVIITLYVVVGWVYGSAKWKPAVECWFKRPSPEMIAIWGDKDAIDQWIEMGSKQKALCMLCYILRTHENNNQGEWNAVSNSIAQMKGKWIIKLTKIRSSNTVRTDTIDKHSSLNAAHLMMHCRGWCGVDSMGCGWFGIEQWVKSCQVVVQAISVLAMSIRE